ncbi:MAG: uroporphyrinogen decarboxylase family protein [Spirochaetales bacterium]
MKPRERVLTALHREKPDRVPFQATYCPEIAEKLRDKLGIHADHPHDPHSSRWNGYELEKTLGHDALQVGIGWFSNYYLSTSDYQDEWGVSWTVDAYDTPFGRGVYTNVKRGPLYDESAISSYRAPDASNPALYENAQRLIDEEQEEYFIIGRVHTTVFETAWALRGMNNLMCDMVADPDLAEAVLEIPYRYHLEVIRRLARLGVDMIWLGDDMGAQDSMMISPEMWRQFLKPKMAAIIQEAKQIKSDLLIAYHTDGFNWPILPDLIEIGLDVLNPIQAESMDPAELKRQFGNELSFFGGIDVQSTLPFSSPEAVREEFDERFATLGAGGGWLCAPTHHVQLDTPLENLEALGRAVRETTY